LACWTNAESPCLNGLMGEERQKGGDAQVEFMVFTGQPLQQTLSASTRQSRRVSNGLSQHCIQLRLCELLRRLDCWLARRHNLMNRASTGCQKRGLSLGTDTILGFAVGGLCPRFKPMRSNLAHTALRLCAKRLAICPALWPLAQSLFRSATLAASHITYCLTPKCEC
jgi:hypothetical protein